MSPPALSVVMPAFNESGRIAPNVRALLEFLKDLDLEVVVSDDGSGDATAAEAEGVGDPRVKVVRNSHKGRGAALRAGMGAATGEVVVTVDADLSYGPEEVRKLFDHLKAHPECDLVIGSCWMPGGRVEGVPPFRAWVSRTGNRILSHAFYGRVHTMTGVLRGYQRKKISPLLARMVSNGKEFHLEVLDRSFGAGHKVDEVPAALVWRRVGGGRLASVGSILSHLGFLAAHRGVLCRAVASGLLMPWITLMVLIPVLSWMRPGWLGSFQRQHWVPVTAVMGVIMLYGLVGAVLWLLISLESMRWRMQMSPPTPPPPSP